MGSDSARTKREMRILSGRVWVRAVTWSFLNVLRSEDLPLDLHDTIVEQRVDVQRVERLVHRAVD